ncbi:extracellular solute-binding protein [Nonomuraea ferruginea]
MLADDYPEKVTTMLAGGDKTDVITMKNVTDYSRYSARGQLLDITDMVKSTDTSKLAGLDAFNVNDSYFALPYRQDFWLLYYNKAMFDKANIKLDGPITWDDYAKYAQQLSQGDGNQKVYGTYHHTWRSVIQAISAAQTGGDQLSGDYNFFADQYNMALSLQKGGNALDFGTATAQQADYRTMFETAATAMMPMGTWYISGILEAKEKGESQVDWALAPMPQRPGATDVTTFGSPTAFAVNKRSENADLARKFVQFAASKAGAEAITKVGVVPALQDPAITEAYFGLKGMLSRRPVEEGVRAGQGRAGDAGERQDLRRRHHPQRGAPADHGRRQVGGRGDQVDERPRQERSPQLRDAVAGAGGARRSRIRFAKESSRKEP